MNYLKDNLTILVSSCDKNADLWPVFFQIFKKKWPDCPCRIILNTETQSYSFDGLNIECLCVSNNKTDKTTLSYNWSDRLIDNLKQIKTKYTLFLLEDFYIKNQVNTLDVESLVKKLETIKNFGALYLSDNESNYPSYYNKKINLYKRHKFNHYKINATPAIWNTKVLLKILKKHESPWDFEFKGTNRAILFSNKKFFCTYNRYFNSNLPQIFNFNLAEQLARGKWTEEAVKFLTEEKINVDFEKREIINFVTDAQQTELKLLENQRKAWHENSYFLYGFNFLIYKFIKCPFIKIKKKLKKK